MKLPAPTARWIATATVIAVIAVFSVLALRLRAGADPAIGSVTTTARHDSGDEVQQLFGEDDDDGGSSSLPSSPPATRAS